MIIACSKSLILLFVEKRFDSYRYAVILRSSKIIVGQSEFEFCLHFSLQIRAVDLHSFDADADPDPGPGPGPA